MPCPIPHESFVILFFLVLIGAFAYHAYEVEGLTEDTDLHFHIIIFPY